MSLNLGAAGGDEDQVVATINTTPLVDVMLVLLIIFLITIPVVTHTVPLQLPRETNQMRQTRPQNVNISVTRDGDIFWDAQRVADQNALVERLKKVSTLTPQPEVHIRGDEAARYEFVGNVVVACQRAGILKVNFLVEPPARGG